MTGSNPMTVFELYDSVMQESATSAVACFAGQHACHRYDTAIQHNARYLAKTISWNACKILLLLLFLFNTTQEGGHLWREQQEELLCCMQLIISALSRSSPGSCAVSCLPQILGVEQSG